MYNATNPTRPPQAIDEVAYRVLYIACDMLVGGAAGVKTNSGEIVEMKKDIIMGFKAAYRTNLRWDQITTVARAFTLCHNHNVPFEHDRFVLDIDV